MTKKEAYIQKISSNFRISEATAKDVYEIINKYDCDVFCSYMADYDHPEERAAAKQVLERRRGHYSETFQKIFDSIQDFMSKDEEYNIHKMNEEVE